MERLRRWWFAEWDYLVIVACALSIALAVGGMISATIDAYQAAAVYR